MYVYYIVFSNFIFNDFHSEINIMMENSPAYFCLRLISTFSLSIPLNLAVNTYTCP